MAITTVKERLLSFDVRGKFALPNKFGEIRFGWSKFGDSTIWAGQFQKRMTLNGPAISRSRHMWPRNPQTTPQQTWRGTFADGVAEWQSLTAGDKSVYNERAFSLRLSGFNLFMREYLNSQT